MLTRIRQNGFGYLLDTFGTGRDGSQNSSPSSSPQTATTGAPAAPAVPARLPNEPDLMGRLPGWPGYVAPPGQLQVQSSDGDRLVTLQRGAWVAPEATVQNEDGLLVSNPMAQAFKQRQAAGEEARRQASDAETDAMVEEFSKTKRLKDAAEAQASAEKPAAWDAQTDADYQALASQRSTPRTPGRGGFLRMGRGGRGSARG